MWRGRMTAVVRVTLRGRASVVRGRRRVVWARSRVWLVARGRSGGSNGSKVGRIRVFEAGAGTAAANGSLYFKN